MKSSDKPEFSWKWWDSGRPEELKSSELDKALPKLEKALANQEKKDGDARAIDDCLGQLKAFPGAVNKTIRQCDKKKHKDVITVLKKYDALVKEKIKRLEDAKAKGEGDDDDDEGEVSDDQLLDAKFFKDCIKKAKLKSSTEDGISFCLGVHKKPEESKLVFIKKKKFAKQIFKRLYQLSKKNPDLGLKRPKMTYGAAFRDPQAKETLVLQIVDGAPTDIPGMVRKLEKWRKKFKHELLPFKELSIRGPSGKPLERTPDPDEEEEEEGQVGREAADTDAAENAGAGAAEAAEEADLSRELSAAENFVKLWDTTLRQVSDQVEKLRAAMEGQDDPGIRSVHDGLGNVMQKFPDLDLTKLVDAARANDRAAYNRTLRQTAREVSQVHDLLAKGPLLSTIDDNPFVNTNVHATVNNALNNIVSELGV